MGIDSSFGQQFKQQINQGLRKLGITVDPNDPLANMSSAVTNNDVSSVINQIQVLSSRTYSRSIMMRGLDLARIDESNWNKLFPYKFIILQAGANGGYKRVRGLEVILPITPQTLTITSQFASQLSVASRGILEEHNGLNVKAINFTATTGILVSRQTFTLEDKIDGNVQAIFGGTVQAVQGFANAVASVFPRQQAQLPATGNAELQFNGYYQYHVIRAFLELYAELKKKPAGRGYRLGLELGKDRVIYLVTPQAFTTNKSAASPMEINYSFSGIAWGTVSDIELSGEQPLPQFMGNNTSDLQNILNGIRNARRVFQKAKDIIRAVKTDVETNIFGPINNIILSIKEAASIPQTVADFPKELQQALQSTVVKEFDSLKNLLPGGFQASFAAAVQPSLAESSDTGSVQGVVATKADVLADIDFTDSLPVNAITLTPEQQAAVQDSIEAATNTTNSDIQDLIADLEEMSAALESQAITQGVDSPAWDILNSAYESISHLYSLLADNFYGVSTVGEQTAGVNPLLDFYQGYAATGDVAFTKPVSKFAIPFPFRSSLEWLAQKYLGDPTRWFEIAAVNNLQPPYIDEDGFIRAFLTNGQGRQFNLDSADNLFVNQSVWIFSDTIPMQKRKIKSIQKVTDANFIITVDGNDNLGDFLLSENAKMKTYLPNTVNSQKLLYIPMDEPSSLDNTQVTAITFLEETPEMLQMAKIDLLLDHNGDLAVSQDGFQNLSYGKNNLIQAARLKLQSIAGQLLFHPEYGAGVEVGESNADFSIDNLIDRIKESFADDPRYQSVDRVEIQQDSGVLKIRVFLTAADNQGLVPVEFEVDT